MMVVMVTTMMVVDVFTTFRGTEKSLIDPKNRMSSLLRLRMGWRRVGFVSVFVFPERGLKGEGDVAK